MIPASLGNLVATSNLRFLPATGMQIHEIFNRIETHCLTISFAESIKPPSTHDRMSLFKARDWWRSSAGHDSVFDMSSLVVDCLAGEGDDQHMQLVMVSMTGLVQIYQPTNRPGGESRAEDLLLEQQLPLPVLQVESGLFMVNQPGRQLAVLHPRQLSVYQLSRRQGTGSQGDSYVLSLAYQHSLAR